MYMEELAYETQLAKLTLIADKKYLPLSMYSKVFELLNMLTNESLTLAGGWQSPLEKNALKYWKPDSDSNIIYFLAKGINSFPIPQYLNILLNNNKLLVVSKFKSKRSKSSN